MSNPIWKRLNNDQLQGANVALRLLHTYPSVQGRALLALKDLIDETFEEMGSRPTSEESLSNPGSLERLPRC